MPRCHRPSAAHGATARLETIAGRRRVSSQRSSVWRRRQLVLSYITNFPETSPAKGVFLCLPCRAGLALLLSKLTLYLPAHWPSFRSISEFPYFRRRRPDRHGRTRGFAGRRRRVGPQQIGDPLEGGEHALVLLGRRRRVGGANLERRVGSRWQRVGGGDRPRLDADSGLGTGPDVGRTRLKVGVDRRTGLDRLRLNVRGRCRQRAGRNRDWLWPDIVLARRHVGPMGLYVDRRRTSVGEARLDQRVIWCWPIGVDIGECGPGQGFRRFLAARLLLGYARIGLCVLARRQRFRVLHGLTRRLRD